MSIIEHIVLIKVKEGLHQSKVNSMVDAINGLASLDSTLHLTIGPILRAKKSSVNFTHLAHGRFSSKEALGAYLSDPTHLRVSQEIAIPVAEDFMILDWFADRDPHPLNPPPGSGIRFKFLKLKPGVADGVKEEILEGIKGGESANCGENFAEGATKGFSICSIAVFPEVAEMEAAELKEEEEEKVRDYVDDVIEVDFVVPPPSSSSGL